MPSTDQIPISFHTCPLISKLQSDSIKKGMQMNYDIRIFTKYFLLLLILLLMIVKYNFNENFLFKTRTNVHRNEVIAK